MWDICTAEQNQKKGITENRAEYLRVDGTCGRVHQPAVEISMKLRQLGMSSSLKSRKLVRGGNHDSIVRLGFLAAAVDVTILMRGVGFGGLAMMTPGMGAAGAESSSSSSSLMLIKLCRLSEILF